MNCKPGDLAMIVAASRECDRPHVGKIVVIDELVDGECWATDPELPSLDEGCGDMIVVWYDWELRPLRGGDGQDETLTWAGLPNKQEQSA